MKRKHRLLALCLCAALALSLTGCGPDRTGVEPDGEGGSAQVSSPQEENYQAGPFTLAAYPDYSFHPALSGNKINLMLAPLMYEGLFAVDNSFTARPVLCQSHSVSADGLTWTFTLKGNVTFSDGTPLTAEHAAAALKTAMGPASRYAARLADVTGIVARDGAVEITLRRANASLPVLLDIPISLGEGERPAGTGPYVLRQEREGALTLQARRGWWQGEEQLPLQQILLTEIGQTDELIAAFDAGDIALLDVDLMGTNALGYSGSYEVWDYSTTDLVYLGFNTQRGLCRSAQVRRALARAVDRDSIAESTYARHAVPSALPVHPNSTWYDETLAGQMDYSPEALVQTLEELKLKDRELTLLVNSENSAKVGAAERIAYQLTAAGLKVTVDKLPWEDFLSALQAGGFDLYVGEVLLTADFDFSALLSPSGALNYGQWQDQQILPLMNTFRAAQGEDRIQVAAQLCRYLNEQAPIAPICFKNGSALTQWGRLTGLQPVQNNVFFHLEEWSIQ